jgi:hypothetical protein
MERHGIPTDDLHALTKGFSGTFSVKPDDVHYTVAGYEKIAVQVAAEIGKFLPNPTAP